MKQAKPLTREQYLKKFSRAVRWRLGVAEAEEAIADYREMVYQEERDETKLVEELGDPGQAAYLLTDVKGYRRWLIVFAVLALMLVMCARLVYIGRPITVLVGEYTYGWRGIAAMVVGIPLSVFWFRRCGQKSGPLPKKMLIVLVVVLIAGTGLLVGIWCITDLSIYEQDLGGGWSFARLVEPMVLAMMYGGVLLAVAGIGSLVMARSGDRRWLAVYILALTVLAFLVVATGEFHCMDIAAHEFTPRLAIFRQAIPITVVGLLGTGVALC